jgi:ssDNA-binding protein
LKSEAEKNAAKKYYRKTKEVCMSQEKPKVDSVFMLKGVRISFPDIFQAVQYEGAGPFNYRATFLIVPGSVNDKLVQDAITKAANMKWEKKAEEVLKTVRGQSQKFAYISGEQKAYDGYAGMMALTTSRPQESGAPLVLDKNPDVKLTAEDGRIYGGCYVNAKVQVWCQDNKFGKGVRCTLIAVQFMADGESFGGAPPATAEGFETVEETAEQFV